MKKITNLYAVVMAAGMSTRMGRQKLLLEYLGEPMLVKIINELKKISWKDLIVVTGSDRLEIEGLLSKLDVTIVHNNNYINGEMIDSIKVGLRKLRDDEGCVLLVLGDQPTLQVEVVEELIDDYCAGESQIIIPTYDNRRGHPILIDLKLRKSILRLRRGRNLRHFIECHARLVKLFPVHSDSILQDVDTKEEYQRLVVDFPS